MRKLILEALLGVSLLPIVPPTEARVVIVGPHRVHRGRYFDRGRWWGQRACLGRLKYDVRLD
jgi:hypothetical protein